MLVRACHQEDIQIINELLNYFELPNINKKYEPQNYYAVVEINNQVIGVIGLEQFNNKNIGLVRSLAVEKIHQGQKIGGMLLAHIEKIASDKGISKLYLLTESIAEYFAKYGYMLIGREQAPIPIQNCKQFLNQCSPSAKLMIKTIDRNR